MNTSYNISLMCDLQSLVHSNGRYDRVQYECLRCLRAIMNNTGGLRQILGQGEALVLVARSLDPQRASAMLEACKILAGQF